MGQISSAPVELIRVQRGGGKKWRGAVAEMQGWRADHEDAHFMKDQTTEEGYAVFGVLDGHGGCEVARLAAHLRLPSSLQRAADGSTSTAHLETAVAASFVETDAWLRERPEVKRDQSGSTCVVAGLRKKKKTSASDEEEFYEVFIANAGDSRGLVLRRTRPKSGGLSEEEDDDMMEPVSLVIASDDHKPDRQDEHARIAAAGGFVSDLDAAKRTIAGQPANVVARLDGNLAVSRGLGDFAYKRDSRRQPRDQKVSCVPEVYHAGLAKKGDLLRKGDLVILACDGVFDVMTNQELARAIGSALSTEGKKIPADIGDVAARILTACLHTLNSKDNMTLMIIEVGVDGTDYAYRPKPQQRQRNNNNGESLQDYGNDDGNNATPTDDDDLDDDDDDDAMTVGKCIDEIVGVDQYDRQCDEAVKRSYVSFLEYCETDQHHLPREARDLLKRVANEEARGRPGRSRRRDDLDDDDDDQLYAARH